MASQVRVDKISNLAETGAVELTFGASIPSGQTLAVAGNLNSSGIATVGVLSATSANITGVLTATKFIGDGSGLTQVPLINAGKACAFSIIQA